MISCDEAVRRLWEHLELPPSPQEETLLEAHLALCRRCCGEATFADELRGVLRGLPPDEVPGPVARRFEDLIARLENP